MARVTRVFEDKNDVVQNVNVFVSGKCFERAIHKLVMLVAAEGV